MRKILLPIFILIYVNVSAQNNPISKQKIDETFSYLYQTTDDFTGIHYFWNKNFNVNKLKGSGIFTGIKNDHDSYTLQFGIWYNFDKYVAESIKHITIKSSDDNINSISDDDISKLSGNGTDRVYIWTEEWGNSADNFYYKILKGIATSGQCTIRFETENGMIDYSLTEKQIEAIRHVINAWDASNGL